MYILNNELNEENTFTIHQRDCHLKAKNNFAPLISKSKEDALFEAKKMLQKDNVNFCDVCN